MVKSGCKNAKLFFTEPLCQQSQLGDEMDDRQIRYCMASDGSDRDY